MASISELLTTGRTVSFEFFPPRSDEEQERLANTIRLLQPLSPSFVSVTYRGGADSRERTTRVVLELLRTTSLTPMPHLTCVAHSRVELGDIVANFREGGIENLLALGGDALPDPAPRVDLRHAIELVELGRESGIPSIGVAAHPAGHPSSPDLESDRRHLAAKLSAADFAITQFFFKVDEYLRLVDQLDRLGVHKPVIPGIMPITNLGSITRMAQMSGYALPADVAARVERAGDDPKTVRQVGIEMASELCRDLLAAGAPGLHFYTLNFSTATREIHAALGLDSLLA